MDPQSTEVTEDKARELPSGEVEARKCILSVCFKSNTVDNERWQRRIEQKVNIAVGRLARKRDERKRVQDVPLQECESFLFRI